MDSDDSSLISVLPEGVLLAVLSQLRKHELHRLRPVSRAWNATFSSSEFWHVYEQLQSRQESWLFFHFPWMGPSIQSLCWAGAGIEICEPSITTLTVPVASSMLITDWVASKARLCVQCHFATSPDMQSYYITSGDKIWETLPTPPPAALCVLAKMWCVGMAEDETEYWLALLGTRYGSNKRTFTLTIFSSTSRSWSSIPLPTDTTRPASNATIAGGCLYTIHLAHRSLMSLDLSKLDHWKYVRGSLPPSLSLSPVWQDSYLVDMYPTVFEGPRGKLLLLGGLESAGSSSIAWMGVVWELHRPSGAWNEIARAPLSMWTALLQEVKESREPFSMITIKYMGGGDHMFIMATSSCYAICYSLLDGKWATRYLPSAFTV